MLQIEIASRPGSLETSALGTQPAANAQALPVVVWLGFDALPDCGSASFQSVTRSVPEVSDFADPNIVLMVKREGATPAEGLQARLEGGATGRLFRPEILTLDAAPEKADIERIEFRVRRIVAERYAALAKRNTDLTRQLFEVRRVHEDLQAAFEQVEQYLHVNGLNEPKVLLELPPSESGDESALLKLKPGAPVVLALPYELNKIAGLSIHIRRLRSPARSTARLLVTLTSGTAGEIYGAWSTPVDRLPESGWFSFLLDRLSVDYGHSLRIAFQLEGDADLAMALSVRPLLGASITPKPAHPGVEGVVHALPALRLWRGLPGTRMTHSLELQPFDFEDHAESRSERDVVLHLNAEGVEQVFAADGSSAPLVSVDAHEQSVQVHPVAKGIVVAMVRQPVPQTACRLEAIVGVHHEKASGVEFAMTVASNADEALQAFTQQGNRHAVSWVLGTSTHHVPLTVPCEPSQKARHLYLATRLQRGGSTSYAWARFRNLKVVL